MILEFLRRIRLLLQRQHLSRDLDDEITLHKQLRAAKLLSQGMTIEEAKETAQRRFGNNTAVKERAIETGAFPMLEDLWRDLCFAFRLLAKQPVFTIAAILSLALGIGANTAVFSLLNSLSFRSLPVDSPQQLVHIGSAGNNGITTPVPGPVLDDLRADPSLQGVCGFTAGDAIVQTDNQTSSALPTHSLTGDCYQTLGVRPALGRLFTKADDHPNEPAVAVLGYTFWKERFGARANVLGRTIRIGGKPFQVIGVTEPRFQGLLWGYPPSVSAPISQRTAPSHIDPSARFYWADTIARLRPAIDHASFQANLKVKWRRLLNSSLPATFSGANRDELLRMPPVVTSAAAGIDYYYRDRFQTPLKTLLAISLLVLLVACVNVSNLLLARGSQRRREMAIRLAIGAARRRLLRQLMAESALLIFGGLAAGLVLHFACVRLVISAFTRVYGRSDLSFQAPLDGQVLLFAALVTSVVVVVSALLPAWQISDLHSATALKDSSRAVSGAITRSRRLLLAGQVAVTLVILIGANLFAHSLTYLETSAFRFQGDKVLNAQLMPLPNADVDGETAIAYVHNLLHRVKTIPGVESASLASFAPLVSSPYKEDIRRLDQPDRAVLQAPAEFVTEDFPHIMHISLLQGRNFRSTDKPSAPRVTILSESVAKRLFPSSPPLGRHIQFGTEPETRDIEVIGIVSDASLEDPHLRGSGFILLNLWQLPRMGNWGNLQVQVSADTTSVAKALRAEVQKAGRQQIFLLQTLSGLRSMSLLQETLLAATGKIYSALALVLAIVGLFGLLSFWVAQREGEIALRMALGAQRSDVTFLIFQEALWLTGTGLVAGLPLAAIVVTAAPKFLHGVSSLSIGPIFLSFGILVAVTVMAAAVPVYRASAIDPNLALRQS